MSRKQPICDPEIVGTLKRALDDLARATSLMQGVTVALDDVQACITFRHQNPEPGPWDDEHPENRQGD